MINYLPEAEGWAHKNVGNPMFSYLAELMKEYDLREQIIMDLRHRLMNREAEVEQLTRVIDSREEEIAKLRQHCERMETMIRVLAELSDPTDHQQHVSP